MFFYSDVMINADAPENRNIASEIFAKLFAAELEKDQSFENRFEQLKWLMIQYAPDSSFRTISWQLDLGEKGFRYFGYFQKKDSGSIPFAGFRGTDPADDYAALAWSRWKGGLIYKIFLVSGPSGPQYAILNYRQIDNFTKIKSCEFLSIGEEDVILGKNSVLEAKEAGGRPLSRISLSYSADANAGIQLDDSATRLSFDNLIQILGRMPGQGPTWVPDGSYKAYVLKENGRWSYLDKVFTESMDEAPRRNRDDKNKDIFGQTRKKNQ